MSQLKSMSLNRVSLSRVLWGILLIQFLCITGEAFTEEKPYDVELTSRILGSSEQPKMIFILPWRSKIKQQLTVRKSLDNYFDFLLVPKSKNDLEYEHRILLKQLKKIK